MKKSDVSTTSYVFSLLWVTLWSAVWALLIQRMDCCTVRFLNRDIPVLSFPERAEVFDCISLRRCLYCIGIPVHMTSLTWTDRNGAKKSLYLLEGGIVSIYTIWVWNGSRTQQKCVCMSHTYGMVTLLMADISLCWHPSNWGINVRLQWMWLCNGKSCTDPLTKVRKNS